MENDITTKRVGNGHFEVLRNGVKTGYLIINGSLGTSGRGQNMYGFIAPGKTGAEWKGSLAACKRAVAYILKRQPVMNHTPAACDCNYAIGADLNKALTSACQCPCHAAAKA
jgi:hypothetical protein